MKKIVDLEKFKELYKIKIKDRDDEDINDAMYMTGLSDAFMWLASQPDAEEEKHGKWKNGICTNCEFDLRELTDGENDLEQWVWDEGFTYCPNCGAKMDLGEAE